MLDETFLSFDKSLRLDSSAHRDKESACHGFLHAKLQALAVRARGNLTTSQAKLDDLLKQAGFGPAKHTSTTTPHRSTTLLFPLPYRSHATPPTSHLCTLASTRPLF